jgi:hypothetical protein
MAGKAVPFTKAPVFSPKPAVALLEQRLREMSTRLAGTAIHVVAHTTGKVPSVGEVQALMLEAANDLAKRLPAIAVPQPVQPILGAVRAITLDE